MESDALRVVKISRTDADVVIHFETRAERINAYTLASALVGIADAAKAANGGINVGYDIEIVVEAIGAGSFRAQLRAIYTKSLNLFSSEPVRAIVFGIVSTFLYERYFATKEPIKVTVNTDEVVIEHEKEKVIIPRQVYDATRNAEKNPQFVRAMNKTVSSIAQDEKVIGVGFVHDVKGPVPEILIPHVALEKIRDEMVLTPEDPPTRVIEENCDLQIVKAILDRSARKWEFIWRGVKISAPILSDRFFEEFYAHDITIAPGDELSVKLAMKQERDPRIGVYTNVGYEVIEVYHHVRHMKQMRLEESTTTAKD